MQQYIPVLVRSRLFAGVSAEELGTMLSCLGASARTYEKGSYVFHRGDAVGHITVLAAGELHIQRDDFWGDRSIIARVDVGELFGESYLAPEDGVILNDVVAAKDSTVLFFDAKRVVTTCSSACRFHTMVAQNLFFALAEKNRSLVQKLGHMSRRSTREKLLSYLSEQAQRQKRSSFSIPFDRQQLADYLSVDRSAMSRELCKLRDEGVLRFDKNQFTLL